MLNLVYFSVNVVQTVGRGLTFIFVFLYLIHLQANKYKEAEEVFNTLLNDEKSPLKPDQQMFNMMIYMYKKAGFHEKARKTFALMAERGIEQSTVTYNSLMSFETNYKEVSDVYDQVRFNIYLPAFTEYMIDLGFFHFISLVSYGCFSKSTFFLKN